MVADEEAGDLPTNEGSTGVREAQKQGGSHKPHISPPGQGADDALHLQAHEGDVHGARHEAGAGDEVVDVALFVVDGIEEDHFIHESDFFRGLVPAQAWASWALTSSRTYLPSMSNSTLRRSPICLVCRWVT